MNRILLLLLVLALVTSSIAVLLPVNAEHRTIVVPDDFPTISLAIENAFAGDTVFVKEGVYQEPTLDINKPLRLIGEDVNETILKLDPPLVEVMLFHNRLMVPSTAITINANNVKLQGFTINIPRADYGYGGGLHGNGDRIEIVNNKIANNSVYLSGSAINITDNSIASTLEVIGSNQTIANNVIKDNLKVQGSFNLVSANEISSSYYFSGIYLNGSYNRIVGNSFSSMEVDDSNSNVIVGNSFVKLDLREFGRGGCSNNIISKNRVTGNHGVNDGIWLWEGSNNIISANSIRNCEHGLTLGATGSIAKENSVYLNIFVNNSVHVNCLLGSNHTVNRFDNGVKGNYYDTYKGNDGNGDGVGDSPFTVQGTHWDEEQQKEVTIVYFQDNYPLMTPFDIDSVNIDLPDWAYLPAEEAQGFDLAELFPTWLIATISVFIIAGIGFVVYFKKRNHMVKVI